MDKALRLSPGFADARDARAALYLEKGDLERAIQDFDKVLALDARNFRAYNDRGAAYQRKGDLARAMQDYDRALSVRPNRMAFANRGFILLRRFEWDKAYRDLLRASNMGMDVVSAFRAGYVDVASFEKAHGVKMPQDIADIVTIEETSPDLTPLFDAIDKIRESVPPEAWDNFPTDFVKNRKHYVYGHPKETE